MGDFGKGLELLFWGTIVAACVVVGAVVSVTEHFASRAHGREQYVIGYCRALNAAVVADTLCVRGDSIIARVEAQPDAK